MTLSLMAMVVEVVSAFGKLSGDEMSMMIMSLMAMMTMPLMLMMTMSLMAMMKVLQSFDSQLADAFLYRLS